MFNSGKALNVHNSPVANTANNAPINIWDYIGASSQMWKIEHTNDTYKYWYLFKSLSGNKFLENPGYSTSNMTVLKQHELTGNYNQRWVITNLEGQPIPLEYFHLVDTGKHLDMSMTNSAYQFEDKIGVAAGKWNDWSSANGFGHVIRWTM